MTEHNRAVAAAGSDPEAAAAALGRLLAARPGAGPAARGAPAPALRNLLLVLLGAGALERAGALLAEHRALAGTDSLPHVGALRSPAGCMIQSYRGSAFVACFVRNETPLQLPRLMHVLPHWQECAADATPASLAHLPALPRRVFAGAEAAHKRAACARQELADLVAALAAQRTAPDQALAALAALAARQEAALQSRTARDVQAAGGHEQQQAELTAALDAHLSGKPSIALLPRSLSQTGRRYR